MEEKTYIINANHKIRKNINENMEVQAYSNKQAKFKAQLLNPHFKDFVIIKIKK